jgi:hypothetical protein
MAMTKNIPDIQTFAPRWPDAAARPAEQVALTYDGPSDTLFVDFYGTARPAASVALELGDRDYYYLRVDAETDKVVGLQIESFLSYAVQRHPRLVEALDFANLKYIDPEVETNLTKRLGDANHRRADRAAVIDELVRLGRS